jgi:hypothetical protein
MTKIFRFLLSLLIVATCGPFSELSQAQGNTEATWIEWNEPSSFPFSSNGVEYATQTTGLLKFQDGTSVSVTLQGVITQGGSQFGDSPSGFWQNNGFIYSSPESTWTSPTLSDLPNNSDRIDVAMIGGLQTLTFSESVTGLVMNINTLGSWFGPLTGIWSFDESFTLLSQDLGSRPGKELFDIVDQTLSGTESSGTIYFEGPITTLSWDITQPGGGYYTIGTLMTTVPEPSTYALLLLGGAASLWALRRRKS